MDSRASRASAAPQASSAPSQGAVSLLDELFSSEQQQQKNSSGWETQFATTKPQETQQMLTNHSEAGARNSSVNLITSAAAPPKSEGSSISSSPNGGKKGAIALAPPATRGQRQRVTRAGSQPLSPLIVPSASGRQSNTAGPMTAPTSEGPPLQIASTNTVSASFVVDGVSFSIAKLAVSEDGSEVQCCATVSNTNETPIFDYKLQVAVQKSLKVTLTAASTTTIRPSAEINHNFLVEAMDGNLPEELKLKMRVAFSVSGRSVSRGVILRGIMLSDERS